MRRWVLFFLLIFISLIDLKAQVPPPDFDCVREDTLYWQTPMVQCGPIIGYEIYASPQLGLPFALLATVNDPQADFFYHNNPSGDPFYYYILTIADCPGEPAVSSDTLDNLPPTQSPIDYVSVGGQDVEISWNLVADPDVLGYVIYRVTDIGTIPLDTVTSGNTFIDTGADPEGQVEFYYVNSIDRCGVTSFFDQVHNTILLEYEIDSCNQAAILNWNPYNGWTQGIQEYRIMVSENGGPFQMVDNVPPSQTVYNLLNLDKNINYAIKIEAVRLDLGAMSSSNTISFMPDIVQTVIGLNLFNADISGSDVEVSWTWDETSTVSNATLVVIENGNNIINMINLTPPSGSGLQVLNSFLVEGLNAQQLPYTFILEVTDSCGTTVESEAMSTLFLTGTSAPGNAAVLSWNSAEMGDREISGVDVFRVDPSGVRQFWVMTGASTTTVTDGEITGASACYQIEANGSVQLADGSIHEFDQTSNDACVARPIRVYFPNALSPNGVNNEYKPAIINVSSVTFYDMKIYDRWGKVVFQSQDPDIGWDGRNDGELVTSGMYVYYIEIRQLNGRNIERAGEIHVLY